MVCQGLRNCCTNSYLPCGCGSTTSQKTTFLNMIFSFVWCLISSRSWSTSLQTLKTFLPPKRQREPPPQPPTAEPKAQLPCGFEGEAAEGEWAAWRGGRLGQTVTPGHPAPNWTGGRMILKEEMFKWSVGFDHTWRVLWKIDCLDPVVW